MRRRYDIPEAWCQPRSVGCQTDRVNARRLHEPRGDARHTGEGTIQIEAREVQGSKYGLQLRLDLQAQRIEPFTGHIRALSTGHVQLLLYEAREMRIVQLKPSMHDGHDQ